MAERGSDGADIQGSPSENSQPSPSDLSTSELLNENPEAAEFQLADWNDPIVRQLEDLLSSNLNAIFHSAIKKIAAFGYGEDVAEEAISRGGLYFGSKDPISNIVDDTLNFLMKGNSKKMDVFRDDEFGGLRNLVDYTLLEMICVLREANPSLTLLEAMWSLLICDMDISQACEMKGDLLSSFCSKGVSGESSSSSSVLLELKTNTASTLPSKDTGSTFPAAQDETDEITMLLVSRLQGLQNELQGWNEWANRKVMQAARRLSKEQAELKTMRQEKLEAEESKKEMEIWKENAIKRLSELDIALCDATLDAEMANHIAHRLEAENSVLKQNSEAEKLRAAESAAKCQEAQERERREKETLKNVQSWERQRGLFQGELANEKLKVAELQQEVGKAKDLRSQVEARLKQERMAKEKVLMQAASIRKDRERLETLAEAEEDRIKQKAENDMQKHAEEIKQLENKLSELRKKSEASTIEALRRSMDASYGSTFSVDSKGALGLKEKQTLNAPKRLAYSRELEAGGSGQQRECVMCLSSEKSVVFLPCAHQVLCEECNDLHEKQGMMECPSCRTPIQQRISVRYHRPWHHSTHVAGMGTRFL